MNETLLLILYLIGSALLLKGLKNLTANAVNEPEFWSIRSHANSTLLVLVGFGIFAFILFKILQL